MKKIKEQTAAAPVIEAVIDATSPRDYQEIALSLIRPSAVNPRKTFNNMEQMIESVRTLGVIQPILVRPEGEYFEIVAGERRYRAALAVANENGGADHYFIPSLVKTMTDDEAFEFMTVENLQREDLSELEEARNFQTYLDRRGEDGTPTLAERLGVSVQYIRRRTMVLSLPEEMLEAWDAGKLLYGHLEQFHRMTDAVKREQLFADVIGGKCTVQHLKYLIDNHSPELKKAIFNRKTVGCTKCVNNSTVQRTLFGDEYTELKAHCLDAACFKKNQAEWLLVNWLDFRAEKGLSTTDFRFREDLEWNEYDNVWKKPHKVCLSCEKFISIIGIDGKIASEKSCLDKQCYATTYSEKKEAVVKDPNAPRCSWHGEYFREAFYETRLPELVNDLPDENEKALRLAILSLLVSNPAACSEFGKQYEAEGFVKPEWASADYPYQGDYGQVRAWRFLEEKPTAELLSILKWLSLFCLLEKKTTFPAIRRLVANHLGVDLKKEWRLTEEYLAKKTVSEIHAIAKQFKLFEGEKAEAYLTGTLGKKSGRFPSLYRPPFRNRHFGNDREDDDLNQAGRHRSF